MAIFSIILDYFKAELIIRTLEGDDAKHLPQLQASGFDHVWSEEDMATYIRDENVIGLVAETRNFLDQKKRIGFVLCRLVADEAEILTIVVDTASRGRGTGRSLMSATLRELYARRTSRLILEVAENNKAAIHLYQKIGFEQIGQREAYYRTSAFSSHDRERALVMACNVS